MKVIPTLLFILGIFLLPEIASAQKAQLRQANRYYQNLNYQGAIEAYLEVLDKRDVTEAKIKLADSYRMVGNNSEAAYWYGQVVKLKVSTPEHKLYYGMALQSLGKCDEAIPVFEAYRQEVPGDLRGQLMKEACETNRIEELLIAGSEFYEVVGLPQLNSDLDDFGASFFSDGLVFASERDKGGPVNRIHSWTGNPFLELYFSEVNVADADLLEFSYSAPEKYEKLFNTRFHDGPLTFSSSERTVYFTRNNLISGKAGKDSEGVVRLKIFSATQFEGKWGEIKGLPFNSDEYSVAHPALSPDNQKLYFASDMPGGFGGMDLYVSTFTDGRWGPPINMNLYIPNINTEGQELFPFVHQNGDLYFASNGRDGLGGLDIYQVRPVGETFGPIVNLGFPINSTVDDFGLILNEARSFGYFASNREGGVGNDDIYAYKRLAVDLDIQVVDNLTGDPIPDAQVSFNCAGGSPVSTNAEGRVTVEVGLDKDCSIRVKAPGYLEAMAGANTEENGAGDKILIQVGMDKPLEFEIAGIVKDSEGNPLEGVELTLSSDCEEEPVIVFSDAQGNFDLELDPDCCYLLTAQKELYFTSAQDLCTRGQTSSKTFDMDLVLAPEPLEDLSTEIDSLMALQLPIIYHLFDKPNWKKESSSDLKVIFEFLETNSDILVLIASHTDARGEANYNQRLSKRRANSVKKYFEKRGIEPSRIFSQGFGESKLANECADGVNCNRTKHQANRRTEIMVVGRQPEGLFPAFEDILD